MLDGALWMAGDNWWVPGLGRRVRLTDETVRFGYTISLTTATWAPNHLVTLRTDVDGWGRDIFGLYEGGAWRFTLDAATYPPEFKVKFIVDRRWFMEGDELPIVAADDERHQFDESRIAFPLAPYAFTHGVDRLSTVDSSYERITPVVRGSEAELYDVIVIGSGMGGGFLADELSDRSVRTLVLEAGGVAFPMHSSNVTGHWDGMAQRDQLGTFVNATIDGTKSGFLFGPHFNLGGRSVYWSGIIPRCGRGNSAACGLRQCARTS